IDPGDDVVDTESLPSDPRADDVRVVAAGDRDEGVGLLDPGLDERVTVEADAGDLPAVEVGAESPEGARILVDNRDGVPRDLEAVRDRRADPATTHDHDMHGKSRYTRRRGLTLAQCL